MGVPVTLPLLRVSPVERVLPDVTAQVTVPMSDVPVGVKLMLLPLMMSLIVPGRHIDAITIHPSTILCRTLPLLETVNTLVSHGDVCP